jgi:hypothetical protein
MIKCVQKGVIDCRYHAKIILSDISFFEFDVNNGPIQKFLARAGNKYVVEKK